MADLTRLGFEIDEDLPPSSLLYTFGGAEPVASVAPGTLISTRTRDAFAGVLQRPGQLVSEVVDSRFLNPQTGPFFVEGAQPGDTLAVHFVDIVPISRWGVSATIPFFGALTSTPETATLQAPLPEMVWFYELDVVGGKVVYQAQDSKLSLDLPMDPMHGTVGVTPPLHEVRSALAPGSWGGNMDTPEIRKGSTVYLGVNVEGAMLSFGDGHARQSEGEACGVAVECAMDSQVVVEVIKGTYPAWPRIETDDFLMTTVGQADGGRVPHRPRRHGDLDERAAGSVHHGRLPAGDPDRAHPGRERVRQGLHGGLQDAEEVPASGDRDARSAPAHPSSPRELMS